MGAQMERGEEEYAARRRDVENRAVEEAHELILKLKEEVEGQRERMGAFERERDMFRRMLAQRGEGGGTLAINSGGATNGASSDAMDVDTPRLLADVQSNFDAYKNEIAIDSQRLRDDLKDAQHAANAARTELAKSKAQAEYTAGEWFRTAQFSAPTTLTSLTRPNAERFRLLTENFELQSNEMAQMSKRVFQLQQSASKQELSVHKVRLAFAFLARNGQLRADHLSSPRRCRRTSWNFEDRPTSFATRTPTSAPSVRSARCALLSFLCPSFAC
jgi:nucleoprotein TPR